MSIILVYLSIDKVFYMKAPHVIFLQGSSAM